MKKAVVRETGERRLRDLAGVGKKTVEDLQALGVGRVAQLAKRNPRALYAKLSELRGKRIDPCCLDVFTCAVAQVRDENLPPTSATGGTGVAYARARFPRLSRHQAFGR